MIYESHSPVEKTNKAPQDTEHDRSNHISLRRLILLRDAACLSKHVDDCDDQGAKRDRTEAVGHSAAESTRCGTFWHSSWFSRAKVPRAVHTRDSDVKGVLDPLRDPKAGECDENQETNDRRTGAILTAGWIRAGAAIAV